MAISFYNAGDNAIYNSGMSYVPQEKYRTGYTAPVQGGGQDASTPSFGIPNTNAFTNSGGSGNNNFNNFNNNPYTANLNKGDFVTNRTSYGTTGYLPGTEPQPSKLEPVMNLIRKGMGMAIPGGNFLMGMAENQSRENRLNATDNAFIDMQLANQEKSLKGVGNIANQDAYGYNKDGFKSNYGDTVKERADIARDFAEKYEDEYKTGKKTARPIDTYYLQKEKEYEETEKQIDFNNFAKQRGLANRIREQIKNKTIDPKFNIHNDVGDKTPKGPTTGSYNTGGQFDGAKDRASYDKDPTSYSGSSKDGGLMGYGGKSGTPRYQQYLNGGRVGYFFGGRVNYKAGGRIGFAGGGKDAAEPDFGNENFGGDKDDNREQYGAVGQYKTGPTSTKTNDGGNKTFFNDSKTLYDNTVLGNFPTGLTTTTPYGRLSAIMDLNKTLEEEDLEGKVQFDSSIGPVNTTTSYDTDIGPTFNASYNNGPVSIGYNNLNGINASYNNGPVSVGYNNGQATLNYSKSFAKGGRVSFKNGGLASIL